MEGPSDDARHGSYEVRESARAKYLRVTVHPDGRVVVTKPVRASQKKLEEFLRERREWIEAARMRARRAHERAEKKYGSALQMPRLRRGTQAYKDAVSRARGIAQERVAHFAALGGFRYGTISIRNQKSRWGSCSAPRGGVSNLSFNYRLAHLPSELVDYLVAHELAHTREHNHGKAFWAEVGKLVPEYAARRKQLHRYRW